MTGVTRGVGCALAALLLLAASPELARAIEAFDGRLQVHGFGEMQVRGLNRSFEEEFDLAQWYNVLNVEVEADILPDGWGPINLLSAYVGAEARYDAIYNEGYWMFPSVSTYGNESRALPLRLRDARDEDWAGVIETNDQVVPPGQPYRVFGRNPSGWSSDEIQPTPVAPFALPSVGNADTFNPNQRQRCPHNSPLVDPTTNAATDVTRGGNPSNSSPNDPANLGPGCMDNRAEKLKIRDREAFPGFDTLFRGRGADAAIGDNPDLTSPEIAARFPNGFYAPDAAVPDGATTTLPPGVNFPATGCGPGPLFNQPCNLEALLLTNYGPVFRGLSFLRDDPATYVLGPVLDWKWTFRDRKGALGSTNTTLLMGPWLPKNFFGSNATLAEIAHPLRGRDSPVTFFNGLPGLGRAAGTRLHALDCRGFPFADDPRCPAALAAGVVDPIDPRLQKLEDLSVSLQQANLGSLFRCLNDNNCQNVAISINEGDGGTPFALGFYQTPSSPIQSSSFFYGPDQTQPFGGDFSGIIPCLNTEPKVARNNNETSAQFIQQTGGVFQEQTATGAAINVPTRPGRYFNEGCIPFTNIRVTGGDGELPLRAAPDLGNLVAGRGLDAQGLFMPSLGTSRVLENGKLDDHEFNCSETDRAWNRCGARRKTYELREAYVDAEFLDSRLWIRAGLQNIVWGKTELFRTTDQFNPQDLALASLPSLEESRIALLSARGVYSLYDVGPLEDVRVELAVNFDRIQPADLGTCGEPYTIDIVCQVTAGLGLHGVTGVGITGVNRPPDGWEDVDGLEFGGRVEFRWDRFSFAVVDFYGYSDFPNANPIFFYERAVDTLSGRPLKAGATSGCANAAGISMRPNSMTPTSGGTTATNLFGSAGNLEAEFLLSDTAAERAATRPSGENTPGDTSDDYARRVEAHTVLGIGFDPGCLKPGGAPGLPNENRYDAELAPDLDEFLANGGDLSEYANPNGTFDPDTFLAGTVATDPGTGAITRTQWGLEGSSVDYALAFHPANQQLFAFICGATVAIAISLSPSSCAWNIFGTGGGLVGGVFGDPFSELISMLMAGDHDRERAGNLVAAIIDNTKGGGQTVINRIPTAPLNSDVRDGRNNASGGLNNRMRSGFQGSGLNTTFFRQSGRNPFGFLTLDSTLTNEQRALLGCGPFYGTRCDSGAPVVRVLILDCNPATLPNDPATNLIRCPPPGNFRDGVPAAPPANPQLRNQQFYVGRYDYELEQTALDGTARYLIVDEQGVPCDRTDPEDLKRCRVFAPGGGIDFLSAEGSVVVQSFPGIEGTSEGWTTWRAETAQPGTTGLTEVIAADGTVLRQAQPFVGGEVCTRYDPRNPLADPNGLVKLPGCRGANKVTVNRQAQTVDVVFDDHYTPRVDGCVFGRIITLRSARNGGMGDVNYTVRAVGADGTPNAGLQAELTETCFNGNFGGPVGSPIPNNSSLASYTRVPVTNAGPPAGSGGAPNLANDWNVSTGPTISFFTPTIAGAGTLFHPLAQCAQAGLGLNNAPIFVGNTCSFDRRDFQSDFIDGNAQVFENELAAWSFNFLQFLTITSCNSVSGGDTLSDPDCFNPAAPWNTTRCSFSTPHLCRNVKGFLGVNGVGRNDYRAGGNPQFGRRDFVWSSGGEVTLEYTRRNVFGFSGDFAEDVTKTNWSFEFTWVSRVDFLDNNSLSAVGDSDALNLTVSVDRPTFINFLNANRTFFMNSQWFFNYLPNWNEGYSFQGPFNVLFTFAIFTGYHQDRFLPQLVTVYDFRSRSAGILPQLAYRFTENFSVTFGISWFVGRESYYPMPMRGIAPVSNRAGVHAYQDGTEQLLSLIRNRDEAWLRLRYTF
jgi:hypothetical protein